MNGSTIDEALPSRKEKHPKAANDLSRWFRWALLGTLVVIIITSIWWGIERTRPLQKSTEVLRPGITSSAATTESGGIKQNQDSSSTEASVDSSTGGAASSDYDLEGNTSEATQASPGTVQTAGETDGSDKQNDGSDKLAVNDNPKVDQAGTVEFSGKTYIVQKGETMYRLIVKFYQGNRAYELKIAKLNHMDDPTKIYAGMELKLPK